MEHVRTGKDYGTPCRCYNHDIWPKGQSPGEDEEEGGQDNEAVDDEADHDRPEVPAQLAELLSYILFIKG